MRTCFRLAKFIPVAVSRPAASGAFPALAARPAHAPVGDDESRIPIAAGHLIPYGRKATALSLGGLTAADRRPSAHAASGGVSITHTFDLAAGPFTLDSSGNVIAAASGLRPAEMRQSSETSVAYAPHGVVLYTDNGGFSGGSSSFGAAYSTDGGYRFTRLYATATAGTTSLFPYPTYAQQPGTFGCAPLCDQVVTYDKYNNKFIWVLQYPQNSAATSNPNFERIAYASPQALAQHGGAAWSYTDLKSSAISSTIALDQPRLGVTPGWVYISFNNPKATILRIAHTAFKDLTYRRGPHGQIRVPAKIPASAVQVVNSSSCAGCSLRVARSTDGHNPGGSWREYFGGIGTTASSVDVASVADNSNFLLSRNVPTWGMAITNGANLADWASLVPNGANWMNRTANTIANPSVTESRGIVFVAWNEGRTVYNAKKQPTDVNGNPLTGFGSTYSQPHIGVAGFADQSSFSRLTTSIGTVEIDIPSYSLFYRNELVNQNYALAMPELATAKDGEVALGFYAGGGPSFASTSGSIYVVHGVGFLWGRQGDPTTFLADAGSDSMTSDTNNVYGDYNTMAPLSTNGNCLVSSATVTQTAAQQNHPVFSLFSHPGNSCPRVSAPPPRKQVTIATHLALSCPAAVNAGSVATVTGQLSPVPSGGGSITVTALGGPGGGTQTVNLSSAGTFSAAFTPGAGGIYSVGASFAGAALYQPSSASCSTTVVPLAPSSLAINCPATATPGDQLTLTATLSPALQGENIQWSATAPDNTVSNQIDPTDATATSYFNVTVAQAGIWTFSAAWAGDATHAGTTSTCQIAVQTPTTLTVACPGVLRPGTPAAISGSLAPDGGGTPISVAYAPPPGSGGTAGTDNVTTDPTGAYADTYGEDASGTWTVTATFAGDATRAPAQTTCTFNVL